MRKKNNQKDSAEKRVGGIPRATRRRDSAEEKIRIVLEGFCGEDSVAELCRKEGINQNLYGHWSKEFVARTTAQVRAFLSRPLGELDLPVVMIDGTGLGDHVVVIALGVDATGASTCWVSLRAARRATRSAGVCCGTFWSEVFRWNEPGCS